MKSIITSLVLVFLVSTAFGQYIQENTITIALVSNTKIYTLKSNKKPLEGKYTIIKENGNQYEASFKKGKIHGEFHQYNKEGIILFTQNYNKGILDGLQTHYFPNGKIMETSTFKNGKINGTTKIYDQNGKIIHERKFTNGKEIKKEKPQKPTPTRK